MAEPKPEPGRVKGVKKPWTRPAIRTGPLFEAKCGKCTPKPDIHHPTPHCQGTPPS